MTNTPICKWVGGGDGKHISVLEAPGLMEQHKNLIKQTNQKFHPAIAWAVMKLRIHLISRLKRERDSVAGREATCFFSMEIKASS